MNQIDCCYINRLNGSDELFKELEKKPNIHLVTTFNCIGNCLQCKEKYHCIANGKRLVANSIEELKTYMDEILMDG